MFICYETHNVIDYIYFDKKTQGSRNIFQYRLFYQIYFFWAVKIIDGNRNRAIRVHQVVLNGTLFFILCHFILCMSFSFYHNVIDYMCW